MMNQQDFDVVIIGGSYAGLSAAMGLGRAIRSVLVIDSGRPCNSQTPHSHNFLTQDGRTPAAIAAQGKEQVLAYPTVRFLQDTVVALNGKDNTFILNTLNGETIKSRKVLFTTGIKDQMPDIAGFAACWGISVIHCPYCHGYEYREQPTGIMVNGDMALEFGRLISNWTNQLTIFTNGTITIPEAHLEQLKAMNIPIVDGPVQEVVHENGYLHHFGLKDGTSVALTALYARLPFVQHCRLPETSGCVISDAGYIQVDAFQKTSVPGIYAAGDNTSMMRSVAGAVAAGSVAAAIINKELIAGFWDVK